MLPEPVHTLLNDVRHGSVYPVGFLATVGTDGSARVRSVVIRHVDEEEHTIYVAGDNRHNKASEIAREPRGEICLVNLDGPVQVRLRCTLKVIEDDRTRIDFWAGINADTRKRVYQVPASVGHPPPHLMVLEGGVVACDILDLWPNVPIRRRFDWRDGAFVEEVLRV